VRDATQLIGRLLRGTLLPRGAGPWSLRRLLVLPVFTLLFLALQTVHWVGFLLDEIFFRGYHRVEVREPLFVVGMPRSGTSFLQRVLAEDTERFTTLRLWELLLAPSVTERTLWLGLGRLDGLMGRPAGRLLDGLARRGFAFMDDVHPVDFQEPEEDYFLLLPAFACFLLVLAWPEHRSLWELARFDDLPEAVRRRLLGHYRRCLQRHLYMVGPEKRILSKNPSFTPMVRSLRETFPDAAFVGCVRDPLEALPSLLSSLEGGAALFGWDVAEPRHRDPFVTMLRDFALRLDEDVAAMPDRALLLPLPELSADVPGTVRRIYGTFGWTPGPALEAALARRAARPPRAPSGHRYALQDFGLEPEDVRHRFREAYRRLDFVGSVAGSGEGSGPSPCVDSPTP